MSGQIIRRGLRVDRLLSLAAAPAFGILALLSATLNGGMPDAMCAPADHSSLLSGMTPMYAVMSALHLGPWLGLIVKR
jgi:hypothetical protein